MKKFFTTCMCVVAATLSMFSADPLDLEVGDLFQADDNKQTGLNLWYEVTSIDPATVKVTYSQDADYTGKKKIPAVVYGNRKAYTVNEIGSNAFDQCEGLEALELPNTIEFIGEWAISATGLKTITIPASVIDIYPHAPFAENTYMTEILVDPENTCYASVDGVLYEKSLETLIQCPGGKKEVKLSKNLKTIVKSAFLGCNLLEKISLPEGLRDMENGAFQKCQSLREVEIPGSLEKIPSWCFGVCENLEKVTLHEGIKTIGICAFEICPNIKEIRIPDSVETIEDDAFKNCRGITELTIGAGMKDMGADAFLECTGIKKVTCYAQTPPEAEYAFYGVEIGNIPLFVPKGTAGLYKAATEWEDFASITEVEYTSVDELNTCEPVVKAENGRILAESSAHGMITIFDAEGRTVATGVDSLEVNAGHGVFIVNIDGKSIKVVI